MPLEAAMRVQKNQGVGLAMADRSNGQATVRALHKKNEQFSKHLQVINKPTPWLWRWPCSTASQKRLESLESLQPITADLLLFV